jgi:Fe-Mn family superoxide dismutase
VIGDDAGWGGPIAGPITHQAGHVPIIGIDIWEHAFYLQYKNVKPDVSRMRFHRDTSWPVSVANHLQYLKAIWNVINFEEAEKRFVEAQ